MELTFNPNASPKAIEAAKKLIERYNSITIDDVENANPSAIFSGRLVANSITGYSSTRDCILCSACTTDNSLNCRICIYSSIWDAHHCVEGCNSKSYHEIYHAKTPEELVAAFRNRAAHITKIVELIEKHQANGTTNS